MNLQSRNIIAVILTGIWVNASEFFRNAHRFDLKGESLRKKNINN